MPGQPQDFLANPRFARAYLRVAPKAEDRGGREHRRELLAGLAGVVAEVGAGPGLTFAHYPPAVTRVIAIEPEPTLRAHAIEAAAAAPVPVEVRPGVAEALPIGDGSCDAVVLALVLCTVADPRAALSEVRRVLRPGGAVRIYEHVRSTHWLVAAAEDLVTPLWQRLAGGCHPNRDPVASLLGAGFKVESVRRFGFAPSRGVPPVAHIIGRATRP